MVSRHKPGPARKPRQSGFRPSGIFWAPRGTKFSNPQPRILSVDPGPGTPKDRIPVEDRRGEKITAQFVRSEPQTDGSSHHFVRVPEETFKEKSPPPGAQLVEIGKKKWWIFLERRAKSYIHH